MNPEQNRLLRSHLFDKTNCSAAPSSCNAVMGNSSFLQPTCSLFPREQHFPEMYPLLEHAGPRAAQRRKNIFLKLIKGFLGKRDAFCCPSLTHQSGIKMQDCKYRKRKKTSLFWLERVFINTRLTRGSQLQMWKQSNQAVCCVTGLIFLVGQNSRATSAPTLQGYKPPRNKFRF